MMDREVVDGLTHLAIAGMSGCEYFITTDRHILKHRTEYEKQFKIKIRTPEEFDREA
jgi:predicted nucleic acid-binding protein